MSIYIHNSIGKRRREDLEQKDVEIVWVELWRPGFCTSPGDKLLLGTVYRTPNNINGRNQKQQWEVISNNIKEALQKHQDEGPVLIVGAWNFKTLNYVAPDILTTSLDESGLSPHSPTSSGHSHRRRSWKRCK